MNRVLEEIQIAVHERVPSGPSPAKKLPRVFASARRAFMDTKSMSADKEAINGMQQKLQGIMHQFGVRTLKEALRRLIISFR
jgi:hypothetical protein